MPIQLSSIYDQSCQVITIIHQNQHYLSQKNKTQLKELQKQLDSIKRDTSWHDINSLGRTFQTLNELVNIIESQFKKRPTIYHALNKVYQFLYGKQRLSSWPNQLQWIPKFILKPLGFITAIIVNLIIATTIFGMLILCLGLPLLSPKVKDFFFNHANHQKITENKQTIDKLLAEFSQTKSWVDGISSGSVQQIILSDEIDSLTLKTVLLALMSDNVHDQATITIEHDPKPASVRQKLNTTLNAIVAYQNIIRKKSLIWQDTHNIVIIKQAELEKKLAFIAAFVKQPVEHLPVVLRVNPDDNLAQQINVQQSLILSQTSEYSISPYQNILIPSKQDLETREPCHIVSPLRDAPDDNFLSIIVTGHEIEMHLNLYSTNIGNLGAQRLANLLIENDCPENLTLDLRNQYIGDPGAVALATALKSPDFPEDLNLDLRSNPIKREGIEALTQALCCDTSPTKLSLGLSIDSDTIGILSNCLLSPNLPSELRLMLDLPNNRHRDRILSCIAFQRVFFEITIQGNLTDNTSRIQTHATRYQRIRTKIHDTGSLVVSNEDTEIIPTMLEVFPNIRSIDLTTDDSNDNMATSLISIIHASRHLEKMTLKLHINNIKPHDFETLLNRLESRKTQQKIELHLTFGERIECPALTSILNQHLTSDNSSDHVYIFYPIISVLSLNFPKFIQELTETFLSPSLPPFIQLTLMNNHLLSANDRQHLIRVVAHHNLFQKPKHIKLPGMEEEINAIQKEMIHNTMVLLKTPSQPDQIFPIEIVGKILSYTLPPACVPQPRQTNQYNPSFFNSQHRQPLQQTNQYPPSFVNNQRRQPQKKSTLDVMREVMGVDTYFDNNWRIVVNNELRAENNLRAIGNFLTGLDR